MDEIRIENIEPVHIDKRGIIMDILNKKINHVGIITTEAGAIRANHYHKTSVQYNYVLSGSFEVSLSNVNNPSKIKKIILSPGKLLTIPPKVIHSFKAIEKTVLLDMISESREGSGYEEDVIRISDIAAEK
jgi:quercetin dioxygenase-like cupin family protein